MHLQNTHMCLREREVENVPLHTCKRINEHAKTPRECQAERSRGGAAINQRRIIAVALRAPLRAHGPRRRRRARARVLRCVVNTRVYVFVIAGACVLCHSPSISSGPRVISVLNRTLLCLCLPSLYLISFSLLPLARLLIGQEGGLRTCWSWQPRAEIKHEWVEMKRLSHRLLINCLNCFKLQLFHHYYDKFTRTLGFVR